MPDANGAINAEVPQKSFDLENGAYTTNEIKIPSVDVAKKHTFFAQVQTLDDKSDQVVEGLIDPMSRKEFAPGDKVITLSTSKDDGNISMTFYPDSLAFVHPDLTFTKVEEGVVTDQAEK